MKMKSIAMLALSGLLISSVMNIAPALADYNNNNMMADSSGQAMQNPNDATQNQNYSMQNTNPAPDNSMNNNPSADDVGSPDTATGDDDY